MALDCQGCRQGQQGIAEATSRVTVAVPAAGSASTLDANVACGQPSSAASIWPVRSAQSPHQILQHALFVCRHGRWARDSMQPTLSRAWAMHLALRC